MTKPLRLEDFGISEETGFLTDMQPLSRLPPYFEIWEVLVDNLPSHIAEKRIRQEIMALPVLEFNGETLTSEAEWWRAMVVLTFLAQAYLWVDGEADLPERIPRILAVPWWRIAEHLRILPVISFAIGVLHNWHRKDPNGPLDADNIHATTTFSGKEDESWFYVVALLVELAAVPGLKAIASIYAAMEHKDNGIVCQDLQDISAALQSMLDALKRMYESCDPKWFYTVLRPFQAGSKGLNCFPEGLIYEGVDNEPKRFSGGSAAQSAIIHVFDIFLQAKHRGSDDEFLREMRLNMPPKHREFLSELSLRPSIRDYVKEARSQELTQCYNSAVEALAQFRSEHVIMVTKYIVMQKPHSVNSSLDQKGTGGTDFMQFLKQVRDNTLALQI